jgi:S1-C subfamily serine protease
MNLACEGDNYFSPKLGLRVADLPADLAKQLGYEGPSGALITGVKEDGLAWRAGLRQGMIVLRTGKCRVKNANDFATASGEKSLSNGMVLLVRTSAGKRIVVVQQWTIPVPTLAGLRRSVAPPA